MSIYRIQYVVVAGFMIFALFCESIGELCQDVGNLAIASPVVLYLVITNPVYLSKMKKSAKKFFVDLFWDLFAWALVIALIVLAVVAFIFSVAGCAVVAMFIAGAFCYYKFKDYLRELKARAPKRRRFSLESFLVDVLDTQDQKRPVKGAIVFLIEPNVLDQDENVIICHAANVDTDELKKCRNRIDAEINHRYAIAAYISQN